MWHVTCDTSHVTHDMLHMTHGMVWTFTQKCSCLALTVWDLWCCEYLEMIFPRSTLTDLMNHEAVCRTDPATPDLLNIFDYKSNYPWVGPSSLPWTEENKDSKKGTAREWGHIDAKVLWGCPDQIGKQHVQTKEHGKKAQQVTRFKKCHQPSCVPVDSPRPVQFALAIAPAGALQHCLFCPLHNSFLQAGGNDRPADHEIHQLIICVMKRR